MEAYGQRHMIKMANGKRDMNTHGRSAMDVRARRPDGLPWDFRKDKGLAKQLVHGRAHRWLIGRPPCVAWCALDQGLKFSKIAPEKVKQHMEEA